MNILYVRRFDLPAKISTTYSIVIIEAVSVILLESLGSSLEGSQMLYAKGSIEFSFPTDNCIGMVEYFTAEGTLCCQNRRHWHVEYLDLPGRSHLFRYEGEVSFFQHDDTCRFFCSFIAEKIRKTEAEWRKSIA